MNKYEYIWIDGSVPTKRLRSKTKMVPDHITFPINWGFDGSSTNQALANNSDLKLIPCSIFDNPVDGGKLVICEVWDSTNPHETNTRQKCVSIFDKTKKLTPLFGLEQEYFIFKGKESIAADKIGMTPPEGRYFCGVGGNVSFGREIAQEHLEVCVKAGISIEGINAEVAPGQWEFQIGTLNPIALGDQVWAARWLLDRIAEKYGYWINYKAKPYTNYNGSGAHLNFSIDPMRKGGLDPEVVCEWIGTRLNEHLSVYGYDYEKRLTGKHETCSYKEFRYGLSDRTASIRISSDRSYIEDRRPNANVDPYEAATVMLETIYNNMEKINFT